MSELRSDRTTVKRIPARGHYNRAELNEVLDAGFVCHVGFMDHGQPFVIPTAYGRRNDRLYIHGATTSRMIQLMEQGVPVCITVTHLDGLVLARSAFHHSMNYRSAMILGKAVKLEADAKMEGLDIITGHILKGRWNEVRKPHARELKATTVMCIPLAEGSVKIRTGPPKDDEPDYDLPIWAGVIPVKQVYGKPISDPSAREEYDLPSSIKNLLGHG